ncbi:hypothetical protein L345_01529, partial [Ophiophagus hannah]
MASNLLFTEPLQCNGLSNAHQHGHPQSFFFANQALRPLHQSQMDFKVIQYDAQGKFLGWQDVKGATLQLCPNSQKILDAAFTMGTTYQQSCALEVSALLQRTPEPIFYEMFLQFEDEKGNTQLWPIPISNPAIVTNNRDLLSSKPTTILLSGFCSVHLPTTAPGEDPPFSLTVRYAAHRIPGIAQISFGVLGFFAVLYALLETSSWARRSRLQNIDLMTILKFFACLVGSLANVFFMVTLGISIYWLIAFKGQQFSTMAITLPAAGSQAETNFIIYALCALILKVVGLKNLASRDLNVSLQPEPNTYQAPWSPILRFGIAASVWLVVAIVQMLVSIGLYQRFVEDKIHQFIDLCSLSNVSHSHAPKSTPQSYLLFHLLRSDLSSDKDVATCFYISKKSGPR